MGLIRFCSKAFNAAGRGADLSFTVFNAGVDAVEAASKNLPVDVALAADSVHQGMVVAASAAYAWRVNSQAKRAEKKPELAKLVSAHIAEITGEAAISYIREKKPAKVETKVAAPSEKKEEAKKA
jgi:hypothetical protein